jgi:hypothetical protein
MGSSVTAQQTVSRKCLPVKGVGALQYSFAFLFRGLRGYRESKSRQGKWKGRWEVFTGAWNCVPM